MHMLLYLSTIFYELFSFYIIYNHMAHRFPCEYHMLCFFLYSVPLCLPGTLILPCSFLIGTKQIFLYKLLHSGLNPFKNRANFLRPDEEQKNHGSTSTSEYCSVCQVHHGKASPKNLRFPREEQVNGMFMKRRHGRSFHDNIKIRV